LVEAGSVQVFWVGGLVKVRRLGFVMRDFKLVKFVATVWLKPQLDLSEMLN
jgi:hypothetical protein